MSVVGLAGEMYTRCPICGANRHTDASVMETARMILRPHKGDMWLGDGERDARRGILIQWTTDEVLVITCLDCAPKLLLRLCVVDGGSPRSLVIK